MLLFVLLLATQALGDISSCPPLPPHVPRDVNDVAPGNIKVMMSVGDSMSAGFGLEGLDGGIDEFRGQVFQLGGDENATTLFNFMKHYSPTVFGASHGHHLVELPGEGYYSNDVLNAAQSNAASGDAEYKHQLTHILSTMQAQKTVDMEKDWKFLNLLMGANTVCPMCGDGALPNADKVAEDYKTYMNNAIQFAYENFPRTIVNIIPMFNLTGIYNLTEHHDYCFAFHKIIPIECPCAFTTNKTQREFADVVLTKFREKVIDISNEWKAKDLPEFTVIYQTYSFELRIPSLEYLSTLDCFHPNKLAHQKLAVATWNSLFLSLAQKPRTWNPADKLVCPTASSRIQTQ